MLLWNRWKSCHGSKDGHIWRLPEDKLNWKSTCTNLTSHSKSFPLQKFGPYVWNFTLCHAMTSSHLVTENHHAWVCECMKLGLIAYKIPTSWVDKGLGSKFLSTLALSMVVSLNTSIASVKRPWTNTLQRKCRHLWVQCASAKIMDNNKKSVCT